MDTVKGAQKRRDERYQVRLPITVRAGSKTIDAFTEDVSYRGLFVRTDEAIALRQLLGVEARLPPDDYAFSSHGMAVFCMPVGNPSGRAPGMGVQFYAMGPERSRWEEYIRSVRDQQALEQAAEQLAEPIRRKHPRVDVRFRVTPSSPSDLLAMYTQNVSKGGMFLETDQEVGEGTALQLDIVHPQSQEVFTLPAVVRHQISTGIGVEFHEIEESVRDAFEEFFLSGVEELTDDDIEFIDEGDPGLM